MERRSWCASLVTGSLVLLSSQAWAQSDRAAETPAILASLGSQSVTVLDNQAAAAVRGQGSEYLYVLVKFVGVNSLDYASDLQWTWNPYGYRYGAWGGPGWTNGGRTDILVTPADPMDQLFKNHDQSAIDDQGLVNALKALPTVPNGFWGLIYVPSAGQITPGSGLPVDKTVSVSGVSLVGGKVFLGWRSMPFTEYARREALTGMQLVAFLR